MKRIIYLKKVTKASLILLAFTTSIASYSQQTIGFSSSSATTSNAPSGSGPDANAKTFTFAPGQAPPPAGNNTAYTPNITATFSFENQQFTSIEGNPTVPGLTFGSSVSNNNTAPSTAFTQFLDTPYGGSYSSNYTACNTCPIGNNSTATNSSYSNFVNHTTLRSLMFTVFADALIDASGNAINNTIPGYPGHPSLDAAVYYGDLVITFNTPVSNPVIHLTDIGGYTTVRAPNSNINVNARYYDLGFSTDFELTTPGLTLSKLSGSSSLTVTPTTIINSATNLGTPSSGVVLHGVNRAAASGTVLVGGSNIRSIRLRLTLRGDGGTIRNNAGVESTATFGNTVRFAREGTYRAATNATGGTLLLPSVNADAMNIAVGLLRPVNVSGNVWHDFDLGNVNSSSAVPIPTGIYANLIDANGNVVASQLVPNSGGTAGAFSFDNVGSGEYTVSISTTEGLQGQPAPAPSLPTGWGNTGEYNGASNTGNDGNVNGISNSFTVVDTDVVDRNFGIRQLASITGNVSIDTNNDDNGDSNPPSAVTLTLYNDVNGDGVLDGSDTQVGTTTADGSGNYAFNNLPPGDYIVVESDPTGYYPVKDETTIDGADRPNTNTNNNEVPVSVVGGETDAGNNFVDEQGVSTISGTVWEDNNDNNQLDKDSGVSGVVISLLDGGGNVIATQTTGFGGTYSFTNVPEGNYTLQIGSTPKPLQYDNDDNNDGGNDGEENNAGGNTSGFNTSDGSIPVSIVGGGVTEVDGSNDFIISNFTNGNAPLPVNLIKFEAKALQDMIRLEWTTASEIGNRGFEIMHSFDAKTFASLGFIQGHHSSNERLSYSFDHDSPLYGKNYYQLYQYDFNKPTPSKSNIISAMYDNESGIMLIYPNPSSSELRIKGVKIGDIIKVYASNGLLVQDKQVSVDNLIELNVERFNGGFYNFVVIRNGLKVMSTKFVKK